MYTCTIVFYIQYLVNLYKKRDCLYLAVFHYHVLIYQYKLFYFDNFSPEKKSRPPFGERLVKTRIRISFKA